MPNDTEPRPLLLRPPLLVQLALVAAVAIYAASVARTWYPPKQTVFTLTETDEAMQELHKLIMDGWRVTHVSTGRATTGMTRLLTLSAVVVGPTGETRGT